MRNNNCANGWRYTFKDFGCLLYAEERYLKLLQIGVQQVFSERIMYIKLNTFISIWSDSMCPQWIMMNPDETVICNMFRQVNSFLFLNYKFLHSVFLKDSLPYFLQYWQQKLPLFSKYSLSHFIAVAKHKQMAVCRVWKDWFHCFHCFCEEICSLVVLYHWSF